MTLEEIKKYLADNKDSEEVQAYLKGLKTVSIDDVKGFLESNEEGKKFLGREKDKFFTKALETWKENNLNSLVDARVKELYPDESEEQRQIKQLKQEIDKINKEKQRETLTNKALTYVTEKGLPTNLVPYFLGEDEEGTFKNLGELETVFSETISKAVAEKFKESGRDVTKGGDPQPQNTDIASLANELNLINK